MSIHDLGLLTGGSFTFANGVSNDGSVIVGQGDTTGSGGISRAWRWTGGVFTNLGVLSGGSYSIARACSADGSVVVGEADNSSGQQRAFKWTSGGGMVSLGTLGTGTASSAYGISDDGTTITGFSTTTPTSLSHPFSWSGSMVDLGLPSFDNTVDQIGIALSADGTVIVGQSNATTAFGWKWATTFTQLGPLPGDTTSFANDVSSDGTLIVGRGTTKGWYWLGGSLTAINPPIGHHDFVPSGVSGNGATLAGSIDFFSGTTHAVTWTIAGGFTVLSDLAGGTSSANSISTDGSIVVGSSSSGAGFHAVYWDTTPPVTSAITTGVSGTGQVGSVSAMLQSASMGVSASGVAGSLVALSRNAAPPQVAVFY